MTKPTAVRLKVMLLFPGQGAQYQGMGRDIFSEFEAARKVFEEASAVVGLDVRELCFEDPNALLNQTRFTQLAVLTHSIACLRVLEELVGHAVPVGLAAGHSLGEYSALVSSRAITFDEALRLVQRRGELMGHHGRGGLIATQLDLVSAQHFAARFDCAVAVSNLPRQTVIGGEESQLEALMQAVRGESRGALRRLQTEGAFHTSLMRRAADEFRNVLDQTEIRRPRYEVVSNFLGDLHPPDPQKIKENLFRQIFNTVLWYQGMQQAFRRGVNVIVELGGGIGDAPARKRPNLADITRRAMREHDSRGIYLAGIDARSLKDTARVLRGIDGVEDTLRADTAASLDAGGNAVGETWFHLFVPVASDMITSRSVDTIRMIEELGLGRAVQIVAEPEHKNLDNLRRLVSEEIDQSQPYLEKVIGCETAAVLYYVGTELAEELIALRQRIEHGARRS